MTEIKITTLSSAPRVPFKFDGRILHTSDRYELVHLTLHPGEAMDMHAQPFDVVFYVDGGTGTLQAGEERFQIEAGTAVHVAKGVMRAWSNPGAEPLRVLVNKILE
ncbi:MAG TPA: cupin domain-containing protein [Bacteroidales bacterium]|nr:cupin domain-containing protein [Bacteroidales bacterium]HPS61541.1 cupin domain-containing protein [Bacteroidales bacterium]